MKLPMASVPLVVAALASAPGLQAQQLSEDQLKTLFQDQIAHVQAAAKPGLGPARGLVLTNVAPAGASPDTGPVTVEAAPGTAKAGGLQLGTPAAELAAVTSGKAPGVYLDLPKEVQVNFQVKFTFDSAALSPDQKPGLRTVCDAIRAADVHQFRIIGHTDASGDASYNQKLSVLRAEEVQRFFVRDCGIDAGRLEAIGVGEQFPFNAKNPLAGVNRRVEFQALS